MIEASSCVMLILSVVLREMRGSIVITWSVEERSDERTQRR